MLKVVRNAAGIIADRERIRNEARRLANRPRRARQRAKRLKRAPAWGNKHTIAEFYRLASELTRVTGIPHEVDHIVPLLGELVSGLHVEANLRVMTAKANREKSNRFHPDGEMVGDAGVEPATSRV